MLYPSIPPAAEPAVPPPQRTVSPVVGFFSIVIGVAQPARPSATKTEMSAAFIFSPLAIANVIVSDRLRWAVLKTLGLEALSCQFQRSSASPVGSRRRPQNPLNTVVTCSTAGGLSKQSPTSARHFWKSAEPRKSTLWFSTVSHWIICLLY